jgi:hypothetical protein
MYIVMYRENPRSSLRCYDRVFKDRDRAQFIADKFSLGASISWVIYVSVPHLPSPWSYLIR